MNYWAELLVIATATLGAMLLVNDVTNSLPRLLAQDAVVTTVWIR
jgi:hypothetical protein